VAVTAVAAALVSATPRERAASRPGDELVAAADVIMDRGFTVPAAPAATWPWLVQLGKGRAGWYLPRSAERALPRARHALRRIDPAWQGLQVGDVIPDYGGASATFEVAILDAPATLVYTSRRGRTNVSWAIMLTPLVGPQPERRPGTRVHFRLRLGPVRHRRLAETAGGLVDLATIALMAAGLRERLAEQHPTEQHPTEQHRTEQPPGEQPPGERPPAGNWAGS
jgi:hypothetical protein